MGRQRSMNSQSNAVSLTARLRISVMQWQALACWTGRGIAIGTARLPPPISAAVREADCGPCCAFSSGVEAFSAGAALALAESYDFAYHRRVLDVGGGTGSFLISVLRRYTDLQGTLFELPGACAVARRHLSGEPEGAE